MINKDFNSIIELVNTFSTEKICIEHLEELRWNGIVISPFDKDSKVYKCAGGRYRCKNTGKYFNVKTGTIFDNTKMPLQKWFLAIWLITSHKKGISSLQLAKDIQITQKSAWFMLQRIRNCFGVGDDSNLGGQIEADETYIGGKNKNRHAIKKIKHTHGRSQADKVPVFGMVERGGNVIAKKVPDTGVHVLTNEIVKYAREEAQIFTDEHLGYRLIKRVYDHQTITHSHGQYADGMIHTNTIEGFWSLLKRGIIGIYHFTSEKHIQKYVDEFSFRYNTRDCNEAQRFNLMLSNCNYRLTYNQLING